MVEEQSEVIMQRLKKNCKRGFGSFDQHLFKFMMIGKVGIHRIHESCYISGKMQDNREGCTVQYSVYPGMIFWICTIMDTLFLAGSFISVITLKDSVINFYFQLFIINTMLLLVETLETRRLETWCDEKLEKIIRGYSGETYEIT